MTSNGDGLKITKKCKIPGYKYLVWYSKKAITNIICLKNLIKCYMLLSKPMIASWTQHLWSIAVHLAYLICCLKCTLCGLYVCYPKKMGNFGFVLTVEDNMKLFSK